MALVVVPMSRESVSTELIPCSRCGALRLVELDEYGYPPAGDSGVCDDCSYDADGQRVAATRRAATQDLELLRSVIRLARDEGYAVDSFTDRWYRCIGADAVEAVPEYETIALDQLVATGRLEIAGRHHQVRYGRDTVGVRLVRVPKRTQHEECRWAALTPLRAT